MQSTTATDSLVRLQNVANQFPLKASNGSNNAVKNILHNDNNNEQQQVVEPQCSEKNNSFDTLPAEIQLKVFEHLSLRDCVLASIVCRSWHELALRRPSLWRCLVFDDNRSATAHLQTYCQRQYIRNTFVREIKVRRAVGERLSEIFGFAMEHKWDHIEKVTIRTAVLNASLPAFLNTISSTITSLVLKYEYKTWEFKHLILPDSILQQCPNLVSLHYSTTLHHDLWDGYPYLDMPHQNLVDLAINISNRSWYGYKLESLLQSLPKLRRLSVRPDKDEDPELIFAKLSQCCPNLDCLNLINSINDSRTRGPIPASLTFSSSAVTATTTTTTSSSSSDTSEGDRDNVVLLRELVIDDQSNAWYPYAKTLSDDSKDNFIKKCSKTLECLDINGYWFLGPSMLHNLSLYSFPALNMLYLTDVQEQPQYERIALNLCIFLRHTPELFYAEFKGINSVTDAVLKALKTYTYLETLCLSRCRSLTSTGLTDFINGNTFLVELKINCMDALTDTIFGMLGNAQELASLRVLEIVACPNISLAGLDEFINAMEREEGNDTNTKNDSNSAEDSQQQQSKTKRLAKFYINYNKAERPLDVDWAIELLLRRLDKHAMQWSFARLSPHATKFEQITSYEWMEHEKKAWRIEQEVLEGLKDLSIS